jgi:putative ABC transport system substrate-binding protein
MRAGKVGPIVNRRRSFPWSLALALTFAWLVFPHSVAVSAATEIAILKSSDLSAYNQAVEGFRSAATNDNFTFREYDLEGDLERGRKLARRIRASDAALVLAVGVKAALAAKLEVLDVPVVYCLVLDPDKYDLSAPNVSGISLEVPPAQQFATMKTILPKLKRVGVLFDPTKTGRLLQEATLVAKQQGIELLAQPISSEREIPPMLRTLLPLVDALWLVPDTTVLSEESLPFILQESLDANRSVFGFSSEFVKRGALLGLSVNYRDIGKQAARLSRRILDRQVVPPVKTVPDHFSLALNLKTARFLGLEIPPEIERRADERY